MDAKERALLDLRQGLWNNLKYMMDAHANGIVSKDELRARYDGMYQEIYEVDRRIEEWRTLEKTFIEKSKSREPVITHQQVGYDVVDVDVEYDKHKFAEQMDMVEKSVGYDTAVFPIPDPVVVKKAHTQILTGPVIPVTAGGCSCGYLSECVVHCGNGHSTGECPPQHERGITYLKPEYEQYKEEFATTGNEEAFEKMLDCVVIE